MQAKDILWSTSQQVDFYLYFFPLAKEKNLCRDPSTIGYTENSLILSLFVPLNFSAEKGTRRQKEYLQNDTICCIL